MKCPRRLAEQIEDSTFLPQTEPLMTSGRAGDQLKLILYGGSDRSRDLGMKGTNIHQSKKSAKLTCELNI